MRANPQYTPLQRRLLRRAAWARWAIREYRLDPLTALDLVIRPSEKVLEAERRKAA